MKNKNSASVLMFVAVIATVFWLSPLCARAAPANQPPKVSLLWPTEDVAFSSETIKIKASAIDVDGWVTQVQFFVETNLIGVVTNAPFNLLWQAQGFCDRGYFTLRAVAIDNEGATTESQPVVVYQACGRPPIIWLGIVSPADGAMLPEPATFQFSAELLAAADTAYIDFRMNASSLGVVRTLLSATDPPASITVSNLSEGQYNLSLRAQGSVCLCQRVTNILRVVKLGVQSPRLTPDRRLQFEVITSFPEVETIVETSPDLQNWTPILTNTPAGNTFVFTESATTAQMRRFYQVRLSSP